MTEGPLETTRFGTVDAPEEVYELPEGLPGLEGHRFALLPDPGAAWASWLQSTHDPAVALLLVDPDALAIPHAPEARAAELAAILGPGEAISTLRRRVIVREGDRPGEVILNLFAPLYFHPGSRLALQVPLVGSGRAIREPWPPRPENSEPEPE